METLVLTEGNSSLDLIRFAKVLRRAAELVEQGWCKWGLAADEAGLDRDYCDARAVKFCEAGATYRAMHEQDWKMTAPDFLVYVTIAGYGPDAPLGHFGGQYNDFEATSGDEVAAHLRAGAENLERIRYAG